MTALAYALVVALLLQRIAPSSGSPSHKGHDDGDEDYDEDSSHEHKLSETSGHSMLDLSSLGVLAALKLKFLFVLLIAAGVFILISKGYKNPCLFGGCRPSYGYYPYVDYNYVGYEVPAASYVMSAAPLRRPPHPKDAHLTDLSARVWNSIDMAGIAFSVLDIQEDDCRRKLVCQADRAAAKNPLLRAALSWFSGSLARYRTDRSEEGPEERLHDEDPCEELYPQCAHHDLPAALGGPELTLTEHHAHLHDGHHHLDHEAPAPSLALEPWMRPQHEYRHEYLYEYPPYRDDGAPSSEAASPLGNPTHEESVGALADLSESSSAASAVPLLYHRDRGSGNAERVPSASVFSAAVVPSGRQEPSSTTTASPSEAESPGTTPQTTVLRRRVR